MKQNIGFRDTDAPDTQHTSDHYDPMVDGKRTHVIYTPQGYDHQMGGAANPWNYSDGIGDRRIDPQETGAKLPWELDPDTGKGYTDAGKWKQTEAADSYDWEILQKLGQQIPGCITLIDNTASVWKWGANELNVITGYTAAKILGQMNSNWDGHAKEAISAAVTHYRAGCRQERRGSGRRGRGGRCRAGLGAAGLQAVPPGHRCGLGSGCGRREFARPRRTGAGRGSGIARRCGCAG